MSKKIKKQKKEKHVTAAEELLNSIDQYKYNQAKLGGLYGVPNNGGCPSCGYCPTCGRKNQNTYPPAPLYYSSGTSGYDADAHASWY